MDDGGASLKRTLTRFDATMIVMGTIIGIGIFFNPAKTLASTGSGGWSLVAWGIGAALALSGAFTYAALGRLMPQTGGPYVYLREAFGPRIAFLYGWMILVAIGSGATAVVGLVLVEFLARFLHLSIEGLARAIVAAAVIAGLSIVNVVGVQWGSRVQNVFTVLKIVALGVLIAAGLARGSVPISFAIDPDHAPSSVLAGVAAAMAGVLFSFGGWQNLSNVAGEMRAPERDLVPAIVQGVLGVAVLYLLANVAFLTLLPTDELIASPTPAADALARAMGERAGDIAALLIFLSAVGIVNGLLLSLPRVYFAMAKDGLLPAAFGRVSPRFRTPVAAIVAQGTVACALCFVQSVGALTDYVAFADWLFFSLNGFALFVIVRKLGIRGVGLGYPIVPAIFAAGAVAATLGMLVTLWSNACFGVLLLAAGVAVYETLARMRSRTPEVAP